MSDKEFKPYVPADKVMPELTPTSIVLGILLAVIFGGANAYLGLRVGMTVSASAGEVRSLFWSSTSAMLARLPSMAGM